MSEETIVRCDACGNRIQSPKEKAATLAIPLLSSKPKPHMQDPFAYFRQRMWGGGQPQHVLQLCMGCVFGIVVALDNVKLRRSILEHASDRQPAVGIAIHDEVDGDAGGDDDA